jgi:UDP-glucose 4-epimerase
MKRILITGANSYIGTSLERYLLQWPERYAVDALDMTDETWHDASFSQYDVVFHVAGIAHTDVRKPTEQRRKLYFAVNTDLAIATAKKAKSEGVGQFIFMSSACVYGNSSPIGKIKVITSDTLPSPANYYGMSKLMAEEGILSLQDETFRVVVLRPPMIYGKNCKGNYNALVHLAKIMPIFPKVNNQRSMLYIGNFVAFVKLMIDNGEHGIFNPQNREYSNTSKFIHSIAREHGKKIILVGGFEWAVILLGHFVKTATKAFGSLAYDQSISQYPMEYRQISLRESIHISEKDND